MEKNYLKFCSERLKENSAKNYKSFEQRKKLDAFGRPILKKVEKIGSEQSEQIKLATWLDKKGLKFYHVPNGGWRTISEAIRFKRSGVKSGVPDICLPFSSGSYHALYIELKRGKGGVISENQKEWIDYLNSVGNLAIVCHGFEEAKQTIEYYLNLNGKNVA